MPCLQCRDDGDNIDMDVEKSELSNDAEEIDEKDLMPLLQQFV